MFRFAGIRQAIETTLELYDLAILTQSVEGLGVDPQRDQIAGTQRPAVP